MSKKMMISLLITGILVVLLTSTVLAAPSTPNTGGQAGGKIGQISAVGENQFTVKTDQGEERTVSVDENTSYLSRQGKVTFTDLQVGRWVIIRAPQSGDSNYTARLVILLPESFDPSKRQENRGKGTVQSIDSDAKTFTIQTADGEVNIYQVDENTVFRSSKEVESLSALPLGRWVVVQADPDDSLTAKFVLVMPENFDPNVTQAKRSGGMIQSVDVGNSAFTLQTREEEILTIKVDSNTSFLNREDTITGLSDLQVNMRAVVLTSQQEDGSSLAITVAVAKPRPSRYGGTITSVDASAGTFTLSSRNGQAYTIKVDQNTRFRSKDNAITSLADLQPNMQAL
ncbi:MAG: DUF5666 domain-containing protein, partial [Anaerolineales bacterium]|nr:DUF5666 domain-containing protein [Anaerolineales bacterium]